MARGAREVEEEEELNKGGGGGEAETATGGAAPADGVQPERVRSEAEEVETFPRGKGRSGETAGAVGDDKRGDRIKRGVVRGSRRSKERVRDVTRNKNALNTEIDPCGR